MYKVCEILLNNYVCKNIEDETSLNAIVTGNIKKNKVYVGDIVDIDKSYDKYIITKVYKRKNHIIRPRLVNVDQMILIVTIKNPSIDYLMLDKQIIMCKSKNIKPIICVNKIDLINDDDLKYIKENYNNVICISAKEDKGFDNLKSVLENKTSAFSGPSGVGKSTTLSKLLNEKIKTSDVSKNNKGKHTTTRVKLYSLDKNTFVFDTPGFNSFEIYDISSNNLKLYYDEFQNVICDYLDCNHVNEGINECKVKSLKVIENKKYLRYVKIFNELKDKEKLNKKYKK